MSSVNVVAIVGRLTRDPELRALPSGTSVCDLGVAVDDRYKDSNGDWQDRANFFDVTVWGKQGESVAQYMSKGREIAISGELRQERWETDDGSKRSKVKIVASTVQFIGPRPDGDNGGGSSEPRSDVPADTTDLPPEGGNEAALMGASDDDIPF